MGYIRTIFDSQVGSEVRGGVGKVVEAERESRWLAATRRGLLNRVSNSAADALARDRTRLGARAEERRPFARAAIKPR